MTLAANKHLVYAGCPADCSDAAILQETVIFITACFQNTIPKYFTQFNQAV